jgi:hypothetical protein
MKIILKLLLAGCALALSACGTIQTSTPMPAVSQKLSVTALSQPLGLNDIPLATYRVPESTFGVIKYKEVSKTESAFGAAGIIAAHSSGADASKASVDGVEGIFRFDMAAETMRVVKGLRAQGHGSSNLVLDGAADGGTLRLVPHAFLTTKDGNSARLYVFLKVQLLDKGGSEQWWTRYTYYVPGEHPIKGRGSWSANNGQLLREKVAEGLAEAGKVFLKSSNGAQASAWNEKPAKLTMKVPGVDDTFTLDGTVLQQTDKTVIVSPKISTAALFYGVAIIPRNEVQVSPL